MPASAGRVEASVEDAQTGVRSGFVSRATNDGGSQTQHGVMVGRRAGRSASVARGIALSLCSPSAGSSARIPSTCGGAKGRAALPGRGPQGIVGPRWRVAAIPRRVRTGRRWGRRLVRSRTEHGAGSGSPGRSSGDDAPPLRVGRRAAGCSSRLGEELRGPQANPSASDRRAAQGVSPQGTRSRLVFVIAGGAAALRAGPRLARPSRSLSRATR